MRVSVCTWFIVGTETQVTLKEEVKLIYIKMYIFIHQKKTKA